MFPKFEKSNYFTTILRFQVFISGAAVMVLEVLGSRVLSPYFGNTLFVWGSLIGVVLTGLSLGYTYGGKKADNNCSYRIFSMFIFIAGTYTLLITFLSSEIFQIILALNIGERFGPLLATISILGIPAFCLGAITPFSIKLSTESLKTIGRTAGNLYAISTAGGIVGTFATAFFLVPIFGVNTILFTISAILILSSIFGLANYFKFVAIFLIIFSIYSNTAILPVAGVTYQKDTFYHKLIVHDNSINNIRTLILDGNFHSAMDLNNPDRIVYEYVRYFHLGFVFADNPKNVLFIGGGGFTGPKDFLKSYPNVKIDVVEIDKDVIQVGKDYFLVPEDERLQIINQDGRQYLSNTIDNYDIIILDAYDKSYVPFHLMTKEFHEIINEHLSDNGVFIANIITSLDGKSSDLFRAEYKTLDSVFPNVYVYPLSLNQEQMVQNVIIVAHKQDTRLQNKTIKQDYNLAFNILDFADDDYKKSIKIHDVPILTDNFAPVENFMNPLTGEIYFKKIILQNNSAIIIPEERNYSIDQNQFDIITWSFVFIIILYLLCTYLISYTQKKDN